MTQTLTQTAESRSYLYALDPNVIYALGALGQVSMYSMLDGPKTVKGMVSGTRNLNSSNGSNSACRLCAIGTSKFPIQVEHTPKGQKC